MGNNISTWTKRGADRGTRSQRRQQDISRSEPNIAMVQAPDLQPVSAMPLRITVKDVSTSTGSLNQLGSGVNSVVRDSGAINLDSVDLDMLTEGKTIAVGMWAYETRTAGEDVSIGKGTRMIVLDDSSSELWTKVRLLPEEGWVPKNFIKNERSLESEEWFIDVNRKVGLEMLRHPQNQIGAFLIRKREENQKDFSLVMKTGDEKVRQFIIHWEENSKSYYITSQNKFKQLGELVNYYRRNPVPHHTCLTEASVRMTAPVVGLSRADDDKYELDPQDIHTQMQIGEGSFGIVHRGIWQNKVPVAVKEMNKDTMNRNEFLREAQTMKDMIHPSLVKLHGFITSREPIWIVTELVDKGDLLKVLRDENEHDLNSSVFFNMTYEIVEGMVYLASKSLIHRDLAARNILVMENMSVKIADFGMARIIKEDIYNAKQNTKFPVQWTAPEALELRKCSEKSDVWSFGILVFEIYSRGAEPYAGVNRNEILELVMKGRRCRCPDECPTSIYEMMERCWSINCDDRPTFSEIKAELGEDDEGYAGYHDS